MELPLSVLEKMDMNISERDIYFDRISCSNDFSSMKGKFKLCYSVINGLPWIPTSFFFFVLNWLKEIEYKAFQFKKHHYHFSKTDIDDIQHNKIVNNNFKKPYSYIDFNSKSSSFCETKETLKKNRNMQLLIYTWILRADKFIDMKKKFEDGRIDLWICSRSIDGTLRSIGIENFESIDNLVQNSAFSFLKKYIAK